MQGSNSTWYICSCGQTCFASVNPIEAWCLHCHGKVSSVPDLTAYARQKQLTARQALADVVRALATNRHEVSHPSNPVQYAGFNPP